MKSVLSRRLVIRRYAPLRPWVLLAASGVLLLLAAWLMFQFGRKTAGFDALRAASERAELQAQIDELERQQKELRVQLAEGEQAKLEQVRERSELGRSIGELQAQLARAQQDLQFYRGIASPQAAKDRSVIVQQFKVAPRDPAKRRFYLRFTLAREVRGDANVTGNLGVTIDGVKAGAAASVELAAISDSKVRQIPFNFRYLANFEYPITLPVGFEPRRVTLEIRPARAGVSPYRRTFVWNVSGG
jgi:hypothetical protein